MIAACITACTGRNLLRVTIHTPSRMGALARRAFSSALMSDTKWRKLLAALAAMEPAPGRMLVKFIDVETPRQMAFPPCLQTAHAYMDTIEYGPVELRAIEWMELECQPDPAALPMGQFPIEYTHSGI